MTGNTWDSLKRIQDPVGWIRDKLSSWGLEWFCKRYYGVYPGVVVDNSDPENRGCVRFMCPAINWVKEEDVPRDCWALPSMAGLGTDPDTKQMTGIFWPPDVGTTIWVLFQNGDRRFPVYIGGFLTAENASDTFSSDAALKKGLRTKTGHFIRMNDDPEDLHLTIGKGDGDGGPSPMFLSMTKDGHCMLTNEKGSTLYMNAEKPETSILTANDDGEVTSMLMLGDDKITLATKSGGALGIAGKDITITGDNVIADAKEFNANTGSVKLGKGANEPAVRGMRLMQWELLHQHVVTAPTPGSPTGPGPTPPLMLYNELSEKVFLA